MVGKQSYIYIEFLQQVIINRLHTISAFVVLMWPIANYDQLTCFWNKLLSVHNLEQLKNKYLCQK